MSTITVKKEDTSSISPITIEPSQLTYSPVRAEETDNDISPESVSAMSRKESHRASERKRRERLSMSMNTLDHLIKQTRKFANKKNVKLDKNSIIEHAIAYIKELQHVNELYTKRLEEANIQISNLENLIAYTKNGPVNSLVPNVTPLVYPPVSNKPNFNTKEMPGYTCPPSFVPYNSFVNLPPSTAPQPQWTSSVRSANTVQSSSFDSLVQVATSMMPPSKSS